MSTALTQNIVFRLEYDACQQTTACDAAQPKSNDLEYHFYEISVIYLHFHAVQFNAVVCLKFVKCANVKESENSINSMNKITKSQNIVWFTKLS